MTDIKRTNHNKCWQDIEDLEFSHSVGGNVKWSGHFGKQFGIILKS